MKGADIFFNGTQNLKYGISGKFSPPRDTIIFKTSLDVLKHMKNIFVTYTKPHHTMH